MLLLDKEDKGVAKCDTLVLNILMLILYISKYTNVNSIF